MKQLERRLLALGVPSSVSKDTLAEVTKWLHKSGPEWTVKRLKSLKQEVVSRISDNDYRAPWVARNNDGLPKGPFSWYFRMALTGDDKKISLVINSLMIYSYFISDHITNDQEKKFFSSMESSDETGTLATPRLIPNVGNELKHSTFVDVPFIASVPLSDTKFQAGVDGKSYPETDLGRQIEFACESHVTRYLILKHPRLFEGVLPYKWFSSIIRRLPNDTGPNDAFQTSVGKISFIQEAGFKLRAVANPSRVIQAGLEPLKDFACRLLQEQETDCTFDQQKGTRIIQQWLSEGKVCHSIDLSDATNTFPRTYQIHLIRQMINQLSDSESRLVLHDALELFSECCSMPWFSKQPNGEGKLHFFRRGQPLGLGPSFFIFGYTHNVLLEGLCYKHRLPTDSYVTLGDDVCISNMELARLYRATLNNLGCKISEAKSITSDKFAEFAGVVVTPKRMIYQYKWRDFNDTNFVDVCRQIGQKSVYLLTGAQRAVIEAIAEIPSEIGGMGWNPKGKSLDERLSTPIAQMFAEGPDKPVFLYESAESRNLRFWNDPIVRSYLSYGESPDTMITRKDGVGAEQASEGFATVNNLQWNACRRANRLSNLRGIPLPQFVLSDRTHLKGYFVTSRPSGDPRKSRISCTKSILQRKLRKIGYAL